MESLLIPTPIFDSGPALMHSKELYVIVILLVIANIINIGADIGAMGAALNLLIGGPAHLYCALFALISVALQVRIPYKTYSRILKWLTFSPICFCLSISKYSNGSRPVLWRWRLGACC
jgi:Mn2+/Fe2+ NRAMP family transporter